MTKTYCVYWIHKDGHADYNTQGYVGISSNMKTRFKAHSKDSSKCVHLKHALKVYYGRLSVKILANNLDQEAASLIEEMLRPVPKIGWNIQMGGYNGSANLSRPHRLETKIKIGNALRGNKYPGMCGADNPNFGSAKHYKGISLVDGSEIILHGKQEIFDAGFTPKYIYAFVNGKFPRTHYKKYTWEVVQNDS